MAVNTQHYIDRTQKIDFLSGGNLWTGVYSVRDSAKYKPSAVSTVPLSDGTYVVPTPWKAFYYEEKAEDYRYLYRYYPHHNHNMVAYGKPLGSEVNPAISTWGCGSLWPHEPVVPGWVISDSENSAKNKIRSNDWNIAQSLAELPQTAAFVLLTAQRIFSAYKYAKRLDWAGVRRILAAKHTSNSKSFSQGWLEYQYAITPLVNDCYQLAKALESGLKEPAFQATARKIDSSFQPPSNVPGITGSIHGKFIRGCVTSYTFRVTNQLLFDLERSGLLNPLALAWELYPLSFVFDWFYNLGSLLDSLSLGFGLTFVDGYQTQFVSNTWRAMWHLDGHHDPIGTQRTLTGHTRSMTRVVLHTWPHPLPYFRGFGNLGISKVLSLIALAAARM